MKNWLRVTICIMLIVSVLAMSLSVFADYSEELITGDVATEQWLYYIWYTLRAWGINLSLNEVNEYTESAGDFIWSQVQDWLSSLPSISSFNYLASQWQATFNKYGVFYGNSNFLQDMQDFAEWLVVKFALATNTEHIVTAGLASVVDDDGNTYYAAPYDSPLIDLGTPLASLSKFSDSYTRMTFQNGDFRFTATGETPQTTPRYGRAVFSVERKQLNGSYIVIVNHAINWSSSNYDEYVARLFYFAGGLDNQGVRHDPGIYLLSDVRYKEGNQFAQVNYNFDANLTNYTLGDKFSIIVGDLDISDEEPGISIEIDDDTPYYIEITWPEEIEVSNLPAVVSTGEIENPHLEEAYRPIQGLITYAKDGVAVCTALLYELPDEMVHMWYSVIASIVIWGMIKLMREH